MADNDVTERARALVERIVGCSIRHDVGWLAGVIETAFEAEYERGLEAAEKVCRDIAEPMYPHAAQPVLQCAVAIASLRQPPPTPDPSTEDAAQTKRKKGK